MQRLHSLASLRNLNILLLSTFERRRIALAAIVTVLVLPLLMISQGNDKTDDAVVTVTTTTQLDASLGGESEDGSLEAIILGGPRAGAGSASRIYNFAKATGGIEKIIYSPQFQSLRDRYKLYGASGNRTFLSIRYIN